MAGYIGVCPLCGWYGKMTLHHTLWWRKDFINHPLREKLTIYICQDCHRMVHDNYQYTRYKNPGRPHYGGQE